MEVPVEQGFPLTALYLLVTYSLRFLFYFNDFFLQLFQALFVLYQLMHLLGYLEAIWILVRLHLNRSQWPLVLIFLCEATLVVWKSILNLSIHLDNHQPQSIPLLVDWVQLWKFIRLFIAFDLFQLSWKFLQLFAVFYIDASWQVVSDLSLELTWQVWSIDCLFVLLHSDFMQQWISKSSSQFPLELNRPALLEFLSVLLSVYFVILCWAFPLLG